MEEKYNGIDSVQGIKEDIRRQRKKSLTYKEAELVYSMQHKVTRARAAGAVYKIDTKMVRIKRSIFEELGVTTRIITGII